MITSLLISIDTKSCVLSFFPPIPSNFTAWNSCVLQEGLFHGVQNHVGVDAVHEACKHNLMHMRTIKFKIKHEDYQIQDQTWSVPNSRLHMKLIKFKINHEDYQISRLNMNRSQLKARSIHRYSYERLELCVLGTDTDVVDWLRLPLLGIIWRQTFRCRSI